MVAYPWVGGRGAACRAGGGEGAGLQSLVVLGGAGPSRAGRGALAWEAFLGGACRPVGRRVGEVGALQWVQPQWGGRGHQLQVA